MSSSPMAFGVYQAQTSTSIRMRLWAQMRTWLPVLACAMVFAIESTPYFGADRTSAPLQKAAETIFGYGVGLHWEWTHHLIRKTGHFMGYGVFCLVCFRGFWIELQGAASRLSRELRAHGLAILATFLIASADEVHQSFLPNRTGQFSDVLLDTCGGVALGLVLFLAMQAAEGRRLARERAGCRREPAHAEAAA
ncbi:MAG: VanZ family protein [Terracidiphilus sp.]